jgi:hypothetical protein
VFEWALTGD